MRPETRLSQDKIRQEKTVSFNPRARVTTKFAILPSWLYLLNAMITQKVCIKQLIKPKKEIAARISTLFRTLGYQNRGIAKYGYWVGFIQGQIKILSWKSEISQYVVNPHLVSTAQHKYRCVILQMWSPGHWPEALKTPTCTLPFLQSDVYQHRWRLSLPINGVVQCSGHKSQLRGTHMVAAFDTQQHH